MNKNIAHVAAVCLAGFFCSAHAAINVSTWRYDATRQGQTTTETQLTPANVNTSSFGKLYSYTVDGYVYAQPLLVSGLNVAGTSRNVVFIATEHDSVYAFDADRNLQLWKASLLDAAHGAAAGATSVPSGDIASNDLVPEVGITGTPVIDVASGTIFVVSKSKEAGGEVIRLHALDLASGNEKSGGPVVITAQVTGKGIGNVNGVVTFQPQWELNRTGLLLQDGHLYIAFGAHGDNGPYHGWVLGYDATTLRQTSVFNASPNGKGNGIWHSGGGLAADTVNGNRLFFVTGNFFDIGLGGPNPSVPYTASQNFSNAIVRADISNGGLLVTDTWTPYDQQQLSNADLDQTSGGIVLLPDQASAPVHLMVQIGKNGRIELLDRDNLGGFNSTYNAVTQEIGGQLNGLWSTPAYWNGRLYVWASGDHLKQYTLSNGRLGTSPAATAAVSSGFPGASPVVSSNGTGNGIVWNVKTDAYGGDGQAVLYAHDATNVANQLYGSDQNGTRDAVGKAVKFVVPVVANGKVYVGARSEVSVYGLLAAATPPVPTPTLSPAPGVYPSAQSISISDSLASAAIYYTVNGTAPTTASTRYTGPFILSATSQVQALAVASGYNNSSIASGTYTIGVGPTVNFPNGFASVAGLTLNGTTINTDDSRLQLTSGKTWQAGSAFTSAAVDIRHFATDFTFQLSGSGSMADGMTFTLQAQGPTALGPYGGGLGYGPDRPTNTTGIRNSVAVKFDLYSNAGEGSNSTGVYVNGASPTVPATDLTPSHIVLSSGDTMTAHLVYDGTYLYVTIVDPVSHGTFVSRTAIDIPKTIGATAAYVGFTGGTGGFSASQKILTWMFTSNPTLPSLTYNAETLSPKSSGPTFRTFAYAGFNDGIGTTLDATKVGDNVTFSVNFAKAGTYDLHVTGKDYPTRGQWQLAVDGVNAGTVQDQFASDQKMQEFDLTPLVISAPGVHTFRFTSVGKNPLSTGYTQSFDVLRFDTR